MFRALREQLGSVATGVLLLAIALMVSSVVLYPREVIDAFGLGGDEVFFPIVLGASIVASACFLIVAWWMFAWMFRSLRSFRQFDRAVQGTVAVEFMLVLPVLMFLFGTVFQMAEIAHAQLVFRYSAFSAARSAAVSENFLHFPPPDIGRGMIYSISTEDRKRARTAAVLPLTGIYTPEEITPLPVDYGLVLDVKNLSGLYFKAGNDITIQNSKKSVWINNTFFADEVKKANSALRRFEIKCEYSKLFKDDLSQIIISELNKILAVDKIPSGGGPIGTVLGAVGVKVNPQQIIKDAISGIVKKVIVDSGLERMLKNLPNPISPPVISVRMEYHLKLRPASFFRPLREYIRLQRVAKSGAHEPLLMQTTGGRIDMPIVPPLIKKVNFMFGDSTH